MSVVFAVDRRTSVFLRLDFLPGAGILTFPQPRLAYEDTIAMPVPDPDKVAWAISSHLPERIGQNQGGQRRRRRR